MSAFIEFRSPDAGFDEPIEMWLACHERVRRFARLLGRLVHHVNQRGADIEAREAATAIRRYFNEAAPRHHEDEEVDMFPLLRERGRGTDPTVLEVLDRVEADHVAMAGLWRQLDALLARISAGEPAVPDEALAAQFAAMYDAHIDAEESILLPALRRVVAAAEWNAIGRAMARRRGQERKEGA
jgi:hemerythrin-like domain-containing protein